MKQTTSNTGEGVRKEEPHALLVQPVWKSSPGFLKDLQIMLPYDPAVSPLGMCLSNHSVDLRYLPILVYCSIITRVKLGNLPSCSFANEQIKVMWYIGVYTQGILTET